MLFLQFKPPRYNITINTNSIDSERTFSLTCPPTIVARPLKFDTSDRFACMIMMIDISLES